MPEASHKNWACPRCGSTGYVVDGVLRCGNAGCSDTHEYDPETGDRCYREVSEWRCETCGHMLDTPMHELGCTVA